jgi:Zn-dependent M28 family amino/carboxypeptidase
MLEHIAPEGTTLTELRRKADRAGGVVDLGGEVTVAAKLEQKEMFGENVGGMIPGRGALKDEWIVIGGHLDHLGIGLYGARNPRRVGELHPGADDNASGSAAILMLADSLSKVYANLPDATPARSLLLIGFDAEEAGLHGSRYYVDNPIVPIEKHALMINFDMIGRIVNKRLSVSGVGSAEGMSEWLAPLFEESPLDVVTSQGGFAGSDHLPFMSKRVPFLFAIIKDFHADYHTPDDVSWKINREDAVHTVHLFHDIAVTAATRTAPFVFSSARSSGPRRR